MLVTDAAWPYFVGEARKYVHYDITQMTDLRHAFFVLVCDELPRYKPGVPFHIFFSKRVRQAFSKAKREGMGTSMSDYYFSNGAAIRRAEEALEKKGIYAPKAEEIHDYLLLVEKRNISIKTINTYYAMTPEIMSFDDEKASVAKKGITETPEHIFMKKESFQDFMNVKDKMPGTQRLVLELQHQYTVENGEVPDIKTLTKMMIEKTGRNYTEAVISSMVTNAHQTFRRKYKNSGKYKEHAPVNRVLPESTDMREETMDIIAALDEDTGVFDPLLEE
jgi:DNA-directed RNA polymerase specialized sigma subunit